MKEIFDSTNRVCHHYVGFLVYVPPFVTMTHQDHTGLWYDYLIPSDKPLLPDGYFEFV